MLPDYVLSQHLPPPPLPPTLTVNAHGCVYPSKALLSKLGLRANQPVDLLPPSADHPGWRLDLRLTAARRISWYADTRPRIRGVRLPAGLVEPGTPLTLALAHPGPAGSGLYQLTPIARADPGFTAP